MPKVVLNFILVFTFALVLVNCASRGRPDGGPKDVTPPEIVKEVPENYSTNFNGDEIKIYFNEYIKIKNLQKQLIISPPMDVKPEVRPLGSASKYITIKIKDTLEPNTTYAFNFGNSIEDNNEGNPFTYYKYVFSTSEHIDSLTVKGRIIDAVKQEPENFVSVMLYEKDSTYTDSTVYKQVPKYITNTLDSLTTFTIENVKAGTYKLLAVKDNNGDNKFQQKSDQIAFHEGFITVPTDSVYILKLFQEAFDFNAKKPRLIAGQKIAFGYEGDYKNMKIELLSKNLPNNYKSTITKDEKADSLLYWYKPKLKDVDSLIFKVSNTNYSEEFNVKIKDNKLDTLVITQLNTGTLKPDEDLLVSANIPFDAINTEKITILDKDSTVVDFKIALDTLKNTYAFSFKKTEGNRYNIQALPEAFTDFFGNKSDTLNFRATTKKLDDYGNVRVVLQNAKYPVIVQLTDDKGDVKKELYATEPKPLEFININASKYNLRVIFDTNGNGAYDSGNFLKAQQPERISYYPDKLDVRSGWDLEQEFTLKD